MRALERVVTWCLVGCVEVAAWALHAWTPQDDDQEDRQ